jgi:hypothetical protein
MSPRRAIPEKKKQGGLPPWVIFGAVIIVALIGVLGIIQIMNAAQSTVAPVSNITATGRTRGDANASVKLAEFSDFQ